MASPWVHPNTWLVSLFRSIPNARTLSIIVSARKQALGLSRMTPMVYPSRTWASTLAEMFFLNTSSTTCYIDEKCIIRQWRFIFMVIYLAINRLDERYHASKLMAGAYGWNPNVWLDSQLRFKGKHCTK